MNCFTKHMKCVVHVLAILFRIETMCVWERIEELLVTDIIPDVILALCRL